MRYRPRRLVLTFSAVMSLTAVFTSSPRAANECAALRAWARPYADKSPTLAELTAFDGGRQHAIFAALAPAARVSLWREHLGALARRPDFTPSQRAAAAELRAVVVPEIYTKGSPAQDGARALWTAREGLFPGLAQRRAFLVLGASPVAPATQTNWCDCDAIYGQSQCYPLVCGPPNGCFRLDGCGFSGMDPCTRKCQ